MKIILLFFLFSSFSFGAFKNLINTDNYDTCSCKYDWVIESSTTYLSYTYSNTTFNRSSACFTDSMRLKTEIQNFNQESGDYHSFDLVEIRESCKVSDTPSCPLGQELDNDEVCRDTCGVDGLMINGICEESAECNEGYNHISLHN